MALCAKFDPWIGWMPQRLKPRPFKTDSEQNKFKIQHFA